MNIAQREFCARCAAALGWMWDEVEGYPRRSCWRRNGIKMGGPTSFNPDFDYNDAMKMRGAATAISVVDYGVELTRLCCLYCAEGPLAHMERGVCYSTLQATANQISEAALRVLEREAKKKKEEEHQSSTDHEEEEGTRE